VSYTKSAKAAVQRMAGLSNMATAKR
jgi:hypothetical protein